MPAKRPQRPAPGHAMLLPRTGDTPTGSAVQRAFDAVKTTAQQIQQTAAATQDAVTGVTPGRLLAVPFILSGSGSMTLPDRTCVVHLRGIGQGGGGGGGGTGAAGAGGSSGVLLDLWIGTPGTPLDSLAVAWAAGSGAGLGGAPGFAGTAGADSTITISGVLYTMKGGGGGQGVPNSAGTNSAVPGVPAAGTGPGGIPSFGHGGTALGVPAATGYSGAGGSTSLGAGGAAVFNAGAGLNGDPSGFGGGASGGIGGNNGGNAAAGGFEITPYS